MTSTSTADSPTPGHEGDAVRVFANVLCAVDGTRNSTAAVRMAAGLTGPEGRLTLLAVTGERGSGVHATAEISPEHAEAVLAQAKQVAQHAGVAAMTVLDPGLPPVEVIVERSRAYDLLAMGASSLSRVAGMLVGAVGVDVLSRIEVPTLIVRHSFGGSLRGARVLLASDGLEGSDRIVQLAGALAHEQGAAVTLVHAAGSESHVAGRSIESQGRALAATVPEMSDTYTEPGGAAEVILAAAQRTGAELVVMGSRRLAGVRALGSVSRRVVHESQCSVLLVPPIA